MATVDIAEQLAGYMAQAPGMRPASSQLSLQVVARQPLPPGAKFTTAMMILPNPSAVRPHPEAGTSGVIGHREHRSAARKRFGSICGSTNPRGFNRRTYEVAEIGGRALKHYPPSSANLPCVLGSTNLDLALNLTTAPRLAPRRSERRQSEDAALNIARYRERHIDRLTVCRGGDAVEARIVHRAVEGDAADRYYVAALTHADDRVVASIGDVEI
jgi:hypothetical protein